MIVKKFVVGPLETNCYVVYDGVSHKGVVIDPGSDDRSVGDFIKKEKIDISFIVNTHGHPDHTAGNGSLGFPVLIHKADSVFLFGRCAKFLDDGDIVEAGNIKLGVMHTPGHTPGGICLKGENDLFSGDTLFFEGMGRTDLPGGNTGALIKSIREKLLVLPDDVKVHPGHGPETTIGHERLIYGDMLPKERENFGTKFSSDF